MQCLDKGQVVGRVDGQAARIPGQRWIRLGAHGLHKFRMQPEIAGDMLARRGVMGGIHHQPVQGAAAERIHAFMGARRAVFQKDIVAILLDQGGDEMIDKAGIDEGSVRRHPHDDVGIQFFGGLGIARQHVIFRPAHHGDAVGVAPFHDGLVGGIHAGGHGDVFQQPTRLQAMHDVPQQRLSGDGFEHLARQAARAHTRLYNGDNADILAGEALRH